MDRLDLIYNRLKFYTLGSDIVSLLTVFGCAIRLPTYCLCDVTLRVELRWLLFGYRRRFSRSGCQLASESVLGSGNSFDDSDGDITRTKSADLGQLVVQAVKKKGRDESQEEHELRRKLLLITRKSITGNQSKASMNGAFSQLAKAAVAQEKKQTRESREKMNLEPEGLEESMNSLQEPMKVQRNNPKAKINGTFSQLAKAAVAQERKETRELSKKTKVEPEGMEEPSDALQESIKVTDKSICSADNSSKKTLCATAPELQMLGKEIRLHERHREAIKGAVFGLFDMAEANPNQEISIASEYRNKEDCNNPSVLGSSDANTSGDEFTPFADAFSGERNPNLMRKDAVNFMEWNLDSDSETCNEFESEEKSCRMFLDQRKMEELSGCPRRSNRASQVFKVL